MAEKWYLAMMANKWFWVLALAAVGVVGLIVLRSC